MGWFDGSEHEPFQVQAGPTAALLVHGFMGTPAEMRPLGLALADAGVSVQGIALPGFGQEVPRLGSLRHDDWIRAAVEAWDGLMARHERVTLVGYSMGAAIALHLAAMRSPERIVLLAPLWRVGSGDWRVKFLPLLKHVVRSIKPFEQADFDDPEIREFFSAAQPDLDLDDPQARERLRSEVSLPTATLDELRRLSSASARLAGTVRVPTLIVQGREDQTVRASDTRALMRHFDGVARLEEIDGGHLIVRDDRPSWPNVRDLVVPFIAEAEVSA